MAKYELKSLATIVFTVLFCASLSPAFGNQGQRRIDRLRGRTVFRSSRAADLSAECAAYSRCGRNMTNRGFNVERNCFCDAQCKIYNDCCRNYKDRDAGSVYSSGFRIPKSVLSCAKVRHLPTVQSVYVINKCPRSFKDKDIKRKCEVIDGQDRISQIPVSDRVTGLLFRNAYCAMCFGDNVEYVFWKFNITCKIPCIYTDETIIRNSTQLLRQALANMGLFMSFWDVSFYHENFTYRNCKPHISQCHPSWMNKRIEKQCRGFTSYVYVGKEIYRNKHCALCNFINESDIECRDFRIDLGYMIRGGLSGSSLAILLDINGGSEMVGQYGEREEIKSVVKKKACAPREVYDPFTRVCRQIGCGEGFTLKDGECKRDSNHAVDPVLKYDVIENLYHPERGLQSDCPRIQLNASEFILLDNNSIMVPLFGEVYSPNEYTLNDEYASICTPFTQRNYTVVENSTIYVKMFKFDNTQAFVSFIGTLVSLFALLLHFVVYMCLPPLRNIPGKCLVCLVVSLFVGQLLFLVGTPRTEIPDLCVALAVIMHYSYLAAFFWMNVLAFDIWRTFTADSFQSPFDGRAKRFIWYSVYAWFGPVLVVTVGLLFHYLDPWLPVDDIYRPHYGDGLCWITHRIPLLFLFAAPVAALLFFNIILYILTIKNLCILTENAKLVDKNSKWRFVLYVKLSFIMGLTWVFGFIATSTNLTVLWYVFIVFNSLQGTFICLAFVFTHKVYRLLSEKMAPSRSTDSRYVVNSSRSTNYTRQTTLLSEPQLQAKVVSRETSI